ncbi:MAG: tetratricopeptide repeat protein [Chloroflexota bacterium]
MKLASALLISLFLLTPAAASAQTIEQLQRSIPATSDPVAQSKLYKQLGDAWVAKDDLGQAAEAYLKALQLGRGNFTARERVQMAIYLSWADRLQESKGELNRLLAQDPDNIAARTQLARVLSWSGDLSEAIAQADLVLKSSPDHKEALLVKADALQWQGRYLEAIPIYQALVRRDGDYDARVGLAHSMLAVKNRTSALDALSTLKPVNAQQKRERAKLTEAIDRETRPVVEGRYNYYHDSDQNRLNRYLLSGSFWGGNQKYGLSYRHTDAEDPARDNRAEDLLLSVYSRLTDRFAGGAGIGLTQFDDHHTSNFPIGHVRLDARLFSGSAGASVTREGVSDTAELIENRIRMTNVGLYLDQPLTERVSVHAGYNYKNFSDGNHANDLQFTSQYALFLTPRIVIGHRFRLLDFQKQSHSGFFDPNNYIANRAFASAYYENRYFYTYMEGYIGYETFRRNGVASDNVIHGGAGSLGVKPTANLALEVNVEGGNFAAGTASGFSYFTVGPRLVYRF